MRRTLVVLSIAIALGLIIGCALTPTKGAKDYFPFANGNTWEYREIFAIQSMWFTNIDTTYSVETVDGKATLNDQQAWKLVTKNYNTDTTFDTSYALETSDGVEFYTSLTDTAPMVWKLPLEVGDAWIASIQIIQTHSKVWHCTGRLPIELSKFVREGVEVDTMLAEVVGTETVSVPAGTFSDCYKVKLHHTHGDFDYYFWIAPNVGIAKSEFEVTEQQITTSQKSELMSYDIP